MAGDSYRGSRRAAQQARQQRDEDTFHHCFVMAHRKSGRDATQL
jgi:hypothetical protein